MITTRAELPPQRVGHEAQDQRRAAADEDGNERHVRGDRSAQAESERQDEVERDP
jgi:hypothetical protein